MYNERKEQNKTVVFQDEALIGSGWFLNSALFLSVSIVLSLISPPLTQLQQIAPPLHEPVKMEFFLPTVTECLLIGSFDCSGFVGPVVVIWDYVHRIELTNWANRPMKTTLSTMFTSLSIEEADTCKSHMKYEDLLTLLSGGGGGKSSMSMLTALLLLKLFRHQHAEAQLHQRTFLQEKRTNVVTVSSRRLIQQKKRDRVWHF